MKALILILCLIFIGCKSGEPKPILYYHAQHHSYAEAVEKGFKSWGLPVKRLDEPVRNCLFVVEQSGEIDGDQGIYYPDIKTIFINTNSRQYKKIIYEDYGYRYEGELPFNATHAACIAAHEFGHYLGLEHNMERDSIMDITHVNYINPSEKDKERARNIYYKK